MSDSEILGLVYNRYARNPDVDINDPDKIIIALEKEIMRYRDRIQYDEERIKCLHERLVTIQGDLNTACDKVVTLESQGEGQRDKIERLKRTINRMYGKCIKIQPSETLEAVKENTAGDIIKALADNGYNTITINCYKNIESEG